MAEKLPSTDLVGWLVTLPGGISIFSFLFGRDGHISVGCFRLQAAVPDTRAGVVQVASDVYLVLGKAEVAPHEPRHLALTEAEVVQHCCACVVKLTFLGLSMCMQMVRKTTFSFLPAVLSAQTSPYLFTSSYRVLVPYPVHGSRMNA